MIYFLGELKCFFSSGIVNLIASFLVDQDLAGDVVQNLKDFFRTFYKKVILSGSASFLFSYSIILALQSLELTLGFKFRSLKLILKSSKQIIEDQIQRKGI